MDNYIGKKLEGRYEILELVGFGGMAMVYKAKDLKEDKFVAIKILKDEYLANDDFKRRFRNESKAIAVLSHPGIVKVFDVCFNDNIQYIVMEYIDGITLKEYIQQQGIVKWKEAIHFAVQILKALQHAHDNGIVHRDVKPQNVMLLEDGTIKVMDFGIARFARENGKTISEKAIGSVHYISPEQAKGDVTDEKTDIYAVGVILYEMLIGKVPFDGDSAVSIAIKQMQIEPEKPTLLNPDIPLGLEDIILRAMQKDAGQRYQSAAEMLRDIDEFKKNPTALFEYKYLSDDAQTKYFDKVTKPSKKGVNMKNDNEEKPIKNHSYMLNILAGVTAACVVVAIVAVIFFLKGMQNKPKDIILTDTRGYTVEEAKKLMPDVNIVVVEEVASNDYDAGIIIKQSPESGTQVKMNFDVKVTVSLGKQSGKMPDILNQEFALAKLELDKLGLTVQQIKQTHEEVEQGNVIKTEPEAGATVNQGDVVLVYISTGTPEQGLLVPNLLGKTEMTARGEISKLGLLIGTVELVDSSEPLGTILEQDPKPDSKIQKGGTINIKISNASGIISNPDGNQEGSLTITITLPDGEPGQSSYELKGYINNSLFDIRDVTADVGKKIKYNLYISDGYINDVAEDIGVNVVRIECNGAVFAEYEVDFNTGNLHTLTEPQFELLFPYGYTEYTSPIVAPISSQDDTSSEE